MVTALRSKDHYAPQDVTPEQESLIDYIPGERGEPLQRVQHRDGYVELLPAEEPQPWQDPKTAPLARKSEQLTREEHVARSIRTEAMLIKWTSVSLRKPMTETITIQDAKARALLIDLCHAVGGKWRDVADRII